MTPTRFDPALRMLDEIIVTERLYDRSSRQVDLQRQHSAFLELADYLASGPDKALDRLVELGLELCGADTAGISVEETDADGRKIFRWVAMAGELKHLAGGSTPRDFSPCGVCLDRNQPLLMERLDRYYPYFKDALLPFVEALLLPWRVSHGPGGTLWAVAHSDRHKFDQEDARTMSCLAAFVSGAMRLKTTMLEAQRALAAKQMVSDMAHHINNPLQGAVLALYQASSHPALNAEIRPWIETADAELRRVAALSAELLLRAA